MTWAIEKCEIISVKILMNESLSQEIKLQEIFCNESKKSCSTGLLNGKLLLVKSLENWKITFTLNWILCCVNIYQIRGWMHSSRMEVKSHREILKITIWTS